MDNEFHAANGLPYPTVANHIENDPTPKDQAIYIPSVSPSHAAQIWAEQWDRDLPEGVSSSDLNFLDPKNKLFHISHAMTSAGLALKKIEPSIVTERDRAATIVVADSGGYQIAGDRVQVNGDADREKILRWIEDVADVAMTLDVPTGPVDNPAAHYRYKTVQDCLSATLEHLQFFRNKRRQGKVRFLNVLQGNTPEQADAWYDAVKPFEFEGWAFAGPLRHNMYELCRRLLIMADDGELQGKSWIHVLGTNELDTAVLLTAVQRAINNYINPNLRISFDTSTPYRLLAFNQILTRSILERDRMVMSVVPIFDDKKFVGSKVRWPWKSEIGDRMTIGDVVVKGTLGSEHFRDRLSEVLLSLHNLQVLCAAISEANRVFDLYSINHSHQVGRREGAAVEIIDKVFKSGKMSDLHHYKNKTFNRLRHTHQSETGDIGRYWEELR